MASKLWCLRIGCIFFGDNIAGGALLAGAEKPSDANRLRVRPPLVSIREMRGGRARGTLVRACQRGHRIGAKRSAGCVNGACESLHNRRLCASDAFSLVHRKLAC